MSQNIVQKTMEEKIQKALMEKEEKVLRELSYSLFEYQPLNRYLLDSYNQFLTVGLDKVINNSGFSFEIFDKEYQVRFERVGSYEKPKGPKNDPNSRAYPNYYRTYKEDYCLTVQLKLNVYEIVQGTEKKEMLIRSVDYTGNIPIMLGSDACNTKEADSIREQINECDKDPYGYFVMGFEKALVSQEKTTSNFCYNVVKDKKISCEMLSQNVVGFVSKITLYEAKNVVYATLSRLNSPQKALTIVDMLHLFYLVNPDVKSIFKSKSLEGYFNYFNVPTPKKEDSAYRKALVDFIGYTYFFTATSDDQDKDFIPLPLENYIAETINKSTPDQTALNDLVTAIYMETVPNSTTPKDGEEYEEEDVAEEDDMEMDIEDDEMVQHSSKKKDNVVNWNKWKKMMDTYFFPHIDSEPKFKTHTLMYMFAKFTLCSKNLKDLDNRDDFSVKKVETPGILIQNLFSKSLQNIKKRILQKVKKSIDNAKKKNEKFEYEKLDTLFNQKSTSDHDIITQTFHNSFIRDTWGDARTGKKGVTQQVSRFNLPSVYASIRKISAHSNRQNKIVKPRMIDPSQYMLVAPEETPDNDRIGLMKHLAISTYISYDLSVEQSNGVFNRIHDLIEKLDTDPNPDTEKQAIIMLNGEPIGFTSHPQQLRNELVNTRRFAVRKMDENYRFMSVVVQQESMGPNRVLTFVKVNTNGGRLMMPCFVIGKPSKPAEASTKLALDIVNYEKTGQTMREFLSSIPVSYLETFMRRRKQTREEKEFFSQHKSLLTNLFGNLLNMGIIEYLDAHEIQFSNIAINEQQLKENKIPNFNYSHMILNSEFMFGVTSAIMTFIGHNPPPRVSLYNNHIKQAISIPPSNFLDRMEPHKDKQKIANYSHKRLIGTYMDEIIGTDEQTIYQNACVCIYPFMGETQEDAIMVKESAIKRGLFSSTIYQTYTVENPKFDLKELPEDVRSRYEEGVIKEKISEEKGAKFALEKLRQLLILPQSFFKKYNRLPDEKEQKEFNETSAVVLTVYDLLEYFFVQRYRINEKDLKWRRDKLNLEQQYMEKYKELNHYFTLLGAELNQKIAEEQVVEEKKKKILSNKIANLKKSVNDFKKKMEPLTKFHEQLRSSTTSRKQFGPNDQTNDGRLKMIQLMKQKLNDMEQLKEDIMVQVGPVEAPQSSDLSLTKLDLQHVADLFDWMVSNQYITMKESVMLKNKLMLFRDKETKEYMFADVDLDENYLMMTFNDFVGESQHRLEGKESYDHLYHAINNYNKVSEMEEFGQTNNYMDYTKTRKHLEEFCKQYDCSDRLKKVDYKSTRETYGERVSVKIDEPLGFTKQGDVEKKVLMESEKGVIDRIQKNGSLGIYRVRIRDFHIAQVGDKIAGPYAQKGVIAAIIPDENLPYVMKNGVVPDVFVNPLAFPSRLTIGMFLEGFLGKIISQTSTRQVKDVNTDFFIPQERNGVPVFEVFNDYIDVYKKEEWSKILGYRKNFMTMNEDSFEKITQVRSETEKVIKNLFAKLVKDFKKQNITWDDLSDKDRALFNEIYQDSNITNEKLTLTFGYIHEQRTKVSDLKDMTKSDKSNFENFYRKYFSRDFVNLYDLLPEERNRINTTLEKIKDYGRAFKPYEHEELAELISDLGITGITEKETMINGQTGNIISEERYQFSRELFMKNVLMDRLVNVNLEKAKKKQLENHSNDVLDCLSELLVCQMELRNVSSSDLNDFRQNLKKESRLIIQDRGFESNLIQYIGDTDYITLTSVAIDMFKDIEHEYVVNMAKKLKIVDKDMNIDREITKNMSAKQIEEYHLQKVSVPIPINVGNVSYLILKHYVHDKIQERDDGPVDIVTRQSTKGKKNGGGNRFGEMESNAVVAHGVPYFLQERLNKVVDETKMFVCDSCGQICSHNAKRNPVCPLCRDDSKMSSVSAPFSLKLFADFNTAMGVKNFIYTKVIGKEEQQ